MTANSPHIAPPADSLGEGTTGAEWSPIGPIASRKKADEWRFVLRAVHVGSWIGSTNEGQLALMVRSEELSRALQELTEYEQENRDRLSEVSKKDLPLYHNSWGAAAIVMALVVFFTITGPSQSRSPFFQVGIADTNAILSGALHQTVTALTLHSTTQHLLGNALVGGLLFVLLHRRFGIGLGSVVIVLSGALGNFMNALWHGADHRSLGASTAVMGALGALAATQFIFNRTQPSRKAVITWAPLVTGAALLGTFGSSPTSDLHAHGFGFLSGLLLGLLIAYPIRNRQTPLPLWGQIGFGVLALALVGGAWTTAFVFGPITSG